MENTSIRFISIERTPCSKDKNRICCAGAWIYIDTKGMRKPINKPEYTSPPGVREMGTGPAEYKTPTAKEMLPKTSTTKLVRTKRNQPDRMAMDIRINITTLAADSLILSRTIALWLS